MAIKVALGDARSGWLRKLLGQETRAPMMSEGRRVFAIGDIHGRNDLLCRLLERIDRSRKTAQADDVFVFLGDYIDRGSDSKGVIETLLSLPSHWRTIFLRGNHDQSLLDFLDDPALYRTWRNYGAPETLLSYGVHPPRFDDDKAFVLARDQLVEKCPTSHLQFLRSLQLMHEEEDYLFVHAGVRPGLPLHQQCEQDLLWIRDDFLMSDHLSDKVVVHGHTPSDRPIRRPNRLGLDTGAHATGCLTAAVLERDTIVFLSTEQQSKSAA